MDLVLFSNSKNYWAGYGYLLEKEKNKFNIITTDLYDSLTEYEILLEQSSKYKYIKSIEEEKLEIIIESKFVGDKKNRFYFSLYSEIEEISIPLSFFPNTKLDRNYICDFIFDIKDIDIINIFISDIENGSSTIKNREDLYNLYILSCKNNNLKIIDNGIGTDYIISKI